LIVICCSVCSFHRFEYLFNFDNTFEIHDDIEVLKRMGMAFGLEKGQCAEGNLKLSRTMVPKALEPYVMGKKKVSLRKQLMFRDLSPCKMASA